MKRRGAMRTPGFARADLVAVLVTGALLAGITVPVIAWGGGASGVAQSMANLTTLGMAHLVYAADWNGRQVTWTRDDLGFYADMADYQFANGCDEFDIADPACHPPVIAGWGESSSGGGWGIWAFWPNNSGHGYAFVPINFPGGPNGSGVVGFGNFRFINSAPFHHYVNGRYHDAIYYAPNDTTVLTNLEGCMGQLGEFVADPTNCNPGWSSYLLSAAALFHPDVMRANADGGYQDARALGYGLESPGFFQTQYPDLKTQVIEHHWLQNPPAPCNPAFFGCEPYYFNHGLDSTPATLFYDGSVRLLSGLEVFLADSQVLSQTGGVDGLWHRGTPFGTDGYFIPDGWDFVPLSHHILTTDGILGRDTLGGATPMSAQTPSWEVPRRRPAAARPSVSAPTLTPQGAVP